jgi:hypothetical protein
MQTLEKHSELISTVKTWLAEHPELKSPEDFIFQIAGGINPLMANKLFKNNTIEENIVNIIEFYEEEGEEYPTPELMAEALEYELEDWMENNLEADLSLRGFN